jgi:hypothetical protein
VGSISPKKSLKRASNDARFAGVDSGELVMLIASTLEGSLMIGRLQKNVDAFDRAVQHLEDDFETDARAGKSARRVARS